MSYDHGTQVGGTHYGEGDKPQHWDLVVMYDWDYFQAQIIKYLMRWKKKYDTPEKRLEDLKKARNFLDKYIREVEHYQPAPAPAPVPMGWEYEVPPNLRHEWQIEGYQGEQIHFRHIVTRNIYVCRTFHEALDAHVASCGIQLAPTALHAVYGP